MNKKLFLTIACLMALLLCICTLAACNTAGTGTETDTDVTSDEALSDETLSDETLSDETAADDETSEAASGDDSDAAETTEDINEDVTAIPRYDYFEPNVSENVTIDKSVYSDMKLTISADLQITDADVAEYIEYSIIFGNRVAVDGTTQVTDQALKKGDSAFIYYKGYMDGAELENGSNWDDESPYELGIGSGDFIPGFEEALIGVIPANATKDNPLSVDLVFPEDYDEELAGKAVTFKIAVMYAVQYTLPEYNRDFIVNTLMYEPTEEFYASDAALIKEFEAYVKSVLEENNAENIEYAKTDALWMYLTDTVECRNLNQDEIDFYYDSYVSEIEYYYAQYSSYYGDTFTEYYPDEGSFAQDYMGIDGDDWKAALLEMADLMVRKDMITHAIAELEGIETVTDEEYQEEIDYWVEQYYGYMTADEIVQSMGEVYLRESAFAVKMADWLMEHATFTYE